MSGSALVSDELKSIIEALMFASPDPLTVTDDDIEICLVVTKVQKHLILISAPGNLMHVDSDPGFLLENMAQFL